MNKLIKFVDTIEDGAEEQYGVLMDDECVLCLCCGGTFEKDDYIITDILEWREISITTISPISSTLEILTYGKFNNP